MQCTVQSLIILLAQLVICYLFANCCNIFLWDWYDANDAVVSQYIVYFMLPASHMIVLYIQLRVCETESKVFEYTHRLNDKLIR